MRFHFKTKNQSERIHPESNRIVSRRHYGALVMKVAPLFGLVSLIWFLIRVIPKPSRASYPCMRVATPIASSFVVWLLGLGVSAFAFGKARHWVRKSRYVLASICAGLALAAAGFCVVGTVDPNASFLVNTKGTQKKQLQMW